VVRVMKYKLLCIDVDGTLARDDKSISQVNKDALKKVNDLGIKIAIASGRAPMSVKSILDDIKIPKIAICLNGTYVIAGENVVSSRFFTQEQLDKAFEIVSSFDTNATFNTPHVSVRSHDVSKEWKKQIENGSLKADYILAHTKEEYKKLIYQYGKEVVKVSILERDNRKYEEIKKAFEDTGLYSVAKSDIDYVDITAKDSTKGQGVIQLAKYFNIPLEEVVCIGDNENDFEMLQCAGLSIAMENAVKSIKEVADMVTLDNNHDGVAYAIEHMILEEKENDKNH